MAGQFSVSQNGVLAYSSGALRSQEVQVTWFDRSSKTLGTVGDPADVAWPRISPDGKAVAFDRRDAQTGFNDIWLRDLARGTDSRFTFNSRNNQIPVWSPDGRSQWKLRSVSEGHRRHRSRRTCEQRRV